MYGYLQVFVIYYLCRNLKTLELLNMDNVQLLKDKLAQKRNRLAAEEIRINLKERKLRTRRLIEMGGLVVKAKLDHLPTNTLFGALLTNFESLAKDSNIQRGNFNELSKSAKCVLELDKPNF